jgi:hypothetical protein
MSDTPETDALVNSINSDSNIIRREYDFVELMSLARKLDRERDEARELAGQMSESNQVLLADVKFYRQEWEKLKR